MYQYKGVFKVFAQSVLMYAGWGIWKARHAMIFQKKTMLVQRILFLTVQQAEERANADRDPAGVNRNSCSG